MGAWGTGLYSDDFALDVKNELIDQLKFGVHYREAFEKLKEDYVDTAEYDDPDIPVFWFVCADVLWKYGRLDDDIRQTALSYIDNGGDLHRWTDESEFLMKKRKAVLEKLRQKLMSPQPEAKPIRPYRFFRCDWNVGDVFAMKLQGEEAQNEGLTGTYLIFQVAGKYLFCETYDKTVGHLLPIIKTRLTLSTKKPCLNDYIKDKKLIIMEDGCPASDWKKKYSLLLYMKSMHFFKNRLIYLGNDEIVEPDDDYGIADPDNIDFFNKIYLCLPKQLEDECISAFKRNKEQKD